MRTHDAGSDKQARRTPSRRRGRPFKVRANPVNIRQTSDRFVERSRLQHDDREELTDSERFTYQRNRPDDRWSGDIGDAVFCMRKE